MAAGMLIGVLTTLLVPEPEVKERQQHEHDTRDYFGFVLMFVIAACGFALVFFFSAAPVTDLKAGLKSLGGHAGVIGFFIEALRLALALLVAALLARVLMSTPMVNRQMVSRAYMEPVRDFFRRYGTSSAWLLLALVGVYRISDIVLGVISNIFYQDLGFTKDEIATVVKTFGLFMTIFGGFLGGILAVRYGVMRILFVGAVLSAGTNLLFWLLAESGHSMPLFYMVISADNLSAGLASAAFVAFLSSLTNISFTAVQYAIFSSLMTLLPKLLGGYSGGMVDSMGYPGFFIFTTLIGLPVLWLTLKARTLMDERGDR